MAEFRDREAIERGLLKKGFAKKDGGDHHRYIFLSHDGKKTSIHTKMSRGTRHRLVSTPLITLMARQCRLSTREFLALVDCPMTETAYREITAKQGIG